MSADPVRSGYAGSALQPSFLARSRNGVRTTLVNVDNGDLLLQAETAGFDLLMMTDQSLRYQQNLAARRIAIVVISSTSWPRIQKGIANVVDAITSARPGVYLEVTVP